MRKFYENDWKEIDTIRADGEMDAAVIDILPYPIHEDFEEKKELLIKYDAVDLAERLMRLIVKLCCFEEARIYYRAFLSETVFGPETPQKKKERKHRKHGKKKKKSRDKYQLCQNQDLSGENPELLRKLILHIRTKKRPRELAVWFQESDIVLLITNRETKVYALEPDSEDEELFQKLTESEGLFLQKNFPVDSNQQVC